MATTVYLIRHGETDWNASGRWQGQADVPLNATGVQQAQLLAQRLQRERITADAIYSSDLERAYRTAWYVGDALKVAVQLLPPLREMDVGEWSGKSEQEIRAQYPEATAILDRHEDRPRGGGETWGLFSHRVQATVQAMVAQHPNSTIIMVTHGGAIRVMLEYMRDTYGATVPARGERRIRNTSITMLRCHSYAWELLAAVDATHLAGMEVHALAESPPEMQH